MNKLLFFSLSIVFFGAGCFSKPEVPSVADVTPPAAVENSTATSTPVVATTTPAVIAPKTTTPTTKPKTTTKTPTPVPSTAPKTVSTYYVTITDTAFSPQVIAISVGEKIVWTNKGTTNQTATSANQVWDSSNIFPGTSYSRVFNAPGTYAYRSNVGNFTGSVVVR